MANNETHKQDKTITLNKLAPAEYRTWVVQAEATLGVHGSLDIVRGIEQNPTPAVNANDNCCLPHQQATKLVNRRNSLRILASKASRFQGAQVTQTIWMFGPHPRP
jgi:hypothetical protein